MMSVSVKNEDLQIGRACLTNGIIQDIFNSTDQDIVTLQILDSHAICGGKLYRLKISDGILSTTCTLMPGALKNKLQLHKLCVLQVLDYGHQEFLDPARNIIKKFLVIYEAKILYDENETLGNPLSFETTEREGPPIDIVKAEEAAKLVQYEQNKSKYILPDGPVRLVVPPPRRSEAKPCPPGNLVNIANLGTTERGHQGWYIKARVMNKLPTKRLKYGGMFSFDLADHSGVIKVFAFDKECSIFQPLVKVGAVIWLSFAMIKPAKFAEETVHRFELRLLRTSLLIRAKDLTNVPHFVLNFCKLSELRNYESETVDIVGICIRAGDLLPQHSGNCQVFHRRLFLIAPDSWNCEHELDIYGKYAEDFKPSDNPVVVAKGCKISRQITKAELFLGPSSVFLVNPPELSVTNLYKEWFSSLPTTLRSQLQHQSLEKITPVQGHEVESFQEAKQILKDAENQVANIRGVVTITRTDEQYVANFYCVRCNGEVHDKNLKKLLCVKCDFVDIARISAVFFKLQLGDKTCADWVPISSQALTHRLLNIHSEYVRGMDLSLLHTLQSLKGRKMMVDLKYDKRATARVKVQLMSFKWWSEKECAPKFRVVV